MKHFKNLDKLGSQFSISIPLDDSGLIGRECPVDECKSYFKIQPGTGLKGEDLSCYCPYCGHEDSPDKFFTEAQIEYAKSVALRKFSSALIKDLKSLEFQHKPKGGFGIGISMSVKGRPTPIRYYREENLETEVLCDQCTLRYTIFGVFGYCPDCASHNSFQILNKNLDLILKLVDIAENQNKEIEQQLIENALEDCVSAFDGFGRETCRVLSNRLNKIKRTIDIRFQNISAARDKVKKSFGIDFGSLLSHEDWKHVISAFQKRHLLAHKMGVIDESYLSATGEANEMLGRKVTITNTDVRSLVIHLKTLGKELHSALDINK